MPRSKKPSRTTRKSMASKGTSTNVVSAKRSLKKRTPTVVEPAMAAEADDSLVTLDRRRSERRTEMGENGGGNLKLEKRQKVQRRRQIDPTTCERDYSVEEVEFMNALDEYKRRSGRMFPTCSEVLEVIRSMGYVKLLPSGPVALLGTTIELSKDDQLGGASVD